MHTIYLYYFTFPKLRGILDIYLINSGYLQESLKQWKDERKRDSLLGRTFKQTQPSDTFQLAVSTTPP